MNQNFKLFNERKHKHWQSVNKKKIIKYIKKQHVTKKKNQSRFQFKHIILNKKLIKNQC
jgi:hypothetical protein